MTSTQDNLLKCATQIAEKKVREGRAMQANIIRDTAAQAIVLILSKLQKPEKPSEMVEY